MEQLLRYRPDGGRRPPLMTRDAKRLDSVAVCLGPGDSKGEVAACAFATSLLFVPSDEWKKIKGLSPARRTRPRGSSRLEKQFAAQLTQYGRRTCSASSGSMKKIGGRPSIDFPPQHAAKKDERRSAARLPGRARGSARSQQPDDLKRILQIVDGRARRRARSGLRRIGEMPREAASSKALRYFKTRMKRSEEPPRTVLRCRPSPSTSS
jgi:hypothetical protein